jgi:hypothetical protein
MMKFPAQLLLGTALLAYLFNRAAEQRRKREAALSDPTITPPTG